MADVTLVHCSYHKCLTVYYGRVMHAVFNQCLPWRGYRHYNSHLTDFYAGFRRYRVASVNNRAVDLERLGDFRLSRFIRDPRDLVVSGYFYHRRGGEAWTTIEAPSEGDDFANGVVPTGLRGARTSFAAYLRSIPEEEGLLAELEFRQRHFASMAAWPVRHPRVVTLRYEDIVGHEPEAFRALFEFYGMTPVERRLGDWFARWYALAARGETPRCTENGDAPGPPGAPRGNTGLYSTETQRRGAGCSAVRMQRGFYHGLLGRRATDAHVRNPAPGQWRRHFTPRVRQVFDAQFGALVRQLGYPTA